MNFTSSQTIQRTKPNECLYSELEICSNGNAFIGWKNNKLVIYKLLNNNYQLYTIIQ